MNATELIAAAEALDLAPLPSAELGFLRDSVDNFSAQVGAAYATAVLRERAAGKELPRVEDGDLMAVRIVQHAQQLAERAAAKFGDDLRAFADGYHKLPWSAVRDLDRLENFEAASQEALAAVVATDAAGND